MPRLAVLFWILMAVASPGLGGQGAVDWNKPFPPHKVIGNVYYVGTDQLATFLVTTPEGHDPGKNFYARLTEQKTAAAK